MAQQGGSSRLQKLLRLIDGGSSLETRKAAAEQVANIVSNHPAQLPSVLSAISVHLRHKEWEARVAAGHCLGTIAEHFLHHTPDTLREAITKGEPDIRTDVKNENASADGGQIPVTALLSFATFDVRAVLDQGTPLLASGGDEFDAPQVAAGDAGGLAQQRSNLKKRLGLGGGMEAFVDTGDLITDEDLVVGPAPIKVEEPQKKTGAPELLMSVRERAAAARNAKLAKRKGPVGGGPAQDSKRAKGANGQANANPSTSNQDQDLLDAEAAEQEWQAVLAGRWPFQQLCDRLLVDLLHPQWEVRHGAALALRDILRSQAASAGVHAPVADPPLGWSVAGGKGRLQLGPVSSADIAAARAGNASWLEDCAIHMLCTLALDRFGDYLSDQVVAPVRETTAQALGATARALDPTVVASLVEALCTLAQCSEWEARHGGLQGLKYVLAAQDEISAQLFSAALPASVTGLRDRDDDVRAVAAEALLPVAHLLAADASPEGAHALRLLWDTLLTLEDLSPATKGATTLLAAVYSCAASTPGGGVLGEHSQPLASLVPRLWPHLHHPLSSVRVAATKCLAALMRSQPMEALLPGEELVRAGRLLFQSFLVEEDEAVLAQSEEAWRVLVSATPPALLRASFTSVDLAALFKLASTPPHRKYDATLMVAVALPGAGADGMPALHPSGSSAKTSGDAARATRMRMAAARALGQLAGAMGDGGDNPTLPHVIQAIGGPSAAERILGGSIVAQWACQRSGEPGQGLQQAAQAALSQLEARPVQFVELAKPYSHVEQQARSLMTLASSKGLALPPLTAPFTVEAALAVATQAATGGKEVAVAAQALESSATALQVSQSVLQASAASALAAAVVHVGLLPAKLNSLIQPLIAATRREPQPLLQDQGAAALAQLAVSASTRKPSPTDKVIKNVCGFATGDPAAVPSAAAPPALGEDGEAQPAAAAKKGKGGNEDAATAASTAAAEAAALTRRGGEAMLRSLAMAAGAQLPAILPGLWSQLIEEPIRVVGTAAEQPGAAQAAINALRVLEVVSPALHPDVVPRALDLLRRLAACLGHSNAAVQLAGARALAAIAAAHTAAAMPSVLATVTPLLAAGAPDASRLGAVVAAQEIVSALGLKMVPYVQLAVVPLLTRMSDPAPATRSVASRCFASVVALMPLAHGVPPPPELTPAQLDALQREGGFLQQLLDNRQMEDFVLPFSLRKQGQGQDEGKLRRYQQEGVNWLAFLRRFGLHGVLADDMGVGKTLQATCIVAATAVEQNKAYAASGSDIDRPRPSLIVCPATLVAHWPHEIAKFVEETVLRPLQYHGQPAARAALRPLLPSHNVIVMSYETLRVDVDWVAGIKWAYCVLDEGHAIRNPGSQVARAARRVDAQHRLILSGTPIQNSVEEMWALFDFLMPGFLGSERAFRARYGKALAASRKAKRGSSEAEAGILALDSLHRQVMPFVLRRTKGQVLSDLPPKIIQDVMCDPGDLQRDLYEACVSKQDMAAVTGAPQGEGEPSNNHAFAVLNYLLKLCSHPLLVLDPQEGGKADADRKEVHAQVLARRLGPAVASNWALAEKELRGNLAHSPKLAALRELLIDCGIGTDAEGGAAAQEAELQAADAGHKALIFAQNRKTLDLAEACVLAPMGVTSLRIDGSVEVQERFRRAQRFQSDPTVEVMLLITKVGGLGLNLTAADTVIFLEPDWNPQSDLQAMDRAHRLGQRRGVNVYRLLVRGTVEEEKMSLQRFKLDVANAVVNADNMSVDTMDKGNLLELFTGEAGKAEKKGGDGDAAAAAAAAAGGGKGGLAAVLADLPDVDAAEAQYGEELDLEAFKRNMRGKGS